tara:strand:- start:328 stop:603 length:276 start_codon:yes stop_codon:yes gene_type:complete
MSKEAKELHELAMMPPPMARPKKIYVFVLDFEDGKAYRYSGWDPDNESIEDFLISKEHSISNCEYMTTSSGVLRTPESDENKIQNEIFRSR